MVLQLYILLQRVSFFCAIFWICSFIVNKKSVYQYIYEHRQTAKQQIVQDLTMGLSMHSGTLEHICIDPEGPECYCASFY